MISEVGGGKARLCLCGTSRAGGPEGGRRSQTIEGETSWCSSLLEYLLYMGVSVQSVM